MNKAKKVFLVPSTIALFSLRLWCEVAWWIDWRVMKSCQSNTPSLNRQLYTLVKNACRRVLLSNYFVKIFIIRISNLSLQLKQNNIFWTGAIFFVSIKANTLLDILTVISWCEWYSLQGCIKVVAWGLWHESNLYINIKRSREAADRLWISNVLLMQKLLLIKQRISLSRRHLCKVRIYHSIYVYLGMRKILIWSFTAKLSFEIWFRVTPHDPSWIRIPRETWKTGKT